jgi:hypothetical protein
VINDIRSQKNLASFTQGATASSCACYCVCSCNCTCICDNPSQFATPSGTSVLNIALVVRASAQAIVAMVVVW